jgi:lipopolysaccharide export system permease protein
MGKPALGIVERHLLGLLVRPMAVSLGTVLLALLLERLLRLFDLIAASGSAFEPVVLMVANLVPHYLGLALPAAFFASIFMVVAKLGEDNELDALLAAGRSIYEITRPFLIVSVLLSLFCLYLFGFLQPHSRYRYHVVKYDALHAGWNAQVQENVFADTGRGFVLTADAVDGSGRTLSGVFIRRNQNGIDEVTTASGGRLVPSSGGGELVLLLDDGRIVREDGGGVIERIEFASGVAREDFSTGAPPFRVRGDSERELTLPELWHGLAEPQPAVSPSEMAGEMHARLVRSLSLPLLPLLAVPLGMASKRGRRAPGVVIACLMLLLLQQGVQVGESLAETGSLPAVPAVWGPMTVFAAISLWLFRASLTSPGENPVTRAVSAVEGAIGGLNLRRKPSRKS